MFVALSVKAKFKNMFGHPITFGVTVDDTEKLRVWPVNISEFCYQKAAQVISGIIDFIIREDDEVMDWYHTHSDKEPSCIILT